MTDALLFQPKTEQLNRRPWGPLADARASLANTVFLPHSSFFFLHPICHHPIRLAQPWPPPTTTATRGGGDSPPHRSARHPPPPASPPPNLHSSPELAPARTCPTAVPHRPAGGALAAPHPPPPPGQPAGRPSPASLYSRGTPANPSNPKTRRPPPPTAAHGRRRPRCRPTAHLLPKCALPPRCAPLALLAHARSIRIFRGSEAGASVCVESADPNDPDCSFALKPLKFNRSRRFQWCSYSRYKFVGTQRVAISAGDVFYWWPYQSLMRALGDR